jgi:hypothetical protein
MAVLLLLQLPITVFQRFLIYRHIHTGDVVGGSVKHSGALSVILIFGITIIYSFYLKKNLNFKIFLFLLILFFIPTTINETKVTFFLMPLAIILPLFLFKNENLFKKLKSIFFYSLMIVLLLCSFIYIYDKLYGQALNRSFIDYLIKEKEGRGYVFQKETDISEINQNSKVGRFASLKVAYDYLLRDSLKIFFGTGIGTTKIKKIGFLETENLGLEIYNPNTSTISMLLWETGVLGLLLYFTFHLFLFIDAYYIKEYNNFFGAFGLGWTSVCGIIIPVTFYINLFYIDIVYIPFLFFSGIVVSKKISNQKFV